MAVFPIKYASELPPAVGPNVRANLDLNTGEAEAALAEGRAKAASGEALASAGQKVFEIAQNISQKITDAEDAMAISTLERKSAEIRNTASKAILETQDPATQAQIGQKAAQDILALGAGQRKRVADQHTMRSNQVLPVWDAQVADTIRKTRIRRVEDELAINDQADYESGNAQSFMERQHKAELTGIQTPEMTAKKIADFAANSLLVRFGTAAANGDIYGADELAKQLDGMKLTEEQGKYREQLIGLKNRTAASVKQQFDIELGEKLVALESKRLPPAESDAAYDELIAVARIDPRLNGEQRVQVIDMLLRRKRGEGLMEPLVMSNDQQRVQNIDESGEDSQQLRAEINANYSEGKYGHGDAALRFRDGLVKLLDSEKRRTNWKATETPRGQFRSEILTAGYGDSDVRKVFAYEKAVENWLNEHPDAKSEEAFAAAQSLVVVYRKKIREVIENEIKGTVVNPFFGLPGSKYPTATNPKTGERMIYKDGKWQSLK